MNGKRLGGQQKIKSKKASADFVRHPIDNLFKGELAALKKAKRPKALNQFFQKYFEYWLTQIFCTTTSTTGNVCKAQTVNQQAMNPVG